MATFPSVVCRLVLFLCTRMVDHIAVVVLALFLKGVLLHKVLLIRQLQDDSEEAQQRQDNVLMQSTLEVLDLLIMGLDQVGLIIFVHEVRCLLGDLTLALALTL